MSQLDLYSDLQDAVEQALWQAAVIDTDDGTLATFPNGDGHPVWVAPDHVVNMIVGRVMAVLKLHRTP